MTETPWWQGAAIYQIYPRSFQDTIGNGVGDLAGITRRLDHVASLGIDAIWLSPFFPSPMKDMGYDVADYTGVDPLFGTLADFDALLARAHELGLKVIIDQVLSHSSDKHRYFTESRRDRSNPKADWYVWADPKPDGSPPNNWMSVFGSTAWEWEPRRRQYYLHNFLTEQPDWNLWNPEVQDFLLSTMRFWLDRGVDGFRLDVANFYFHDRELRDNPANPDALAQGWEASPAETYGWQTPIYAKNRPETVGFLRRMRALTDAYDDRMMVGEIGEAGETALRIMAAYTEGADKLHLCYSFALLGPAFSAGHFRSVLGDFRAHAPTGHASWSFSNHDSQRHVTRWGDHAADPDALARQAIALLVSLEGTIGLYQGEELGLPEAELSYDELTDPPGLRFWPEVKGRDGCRTPMVWQAAAPHGGFSTTDPWLPVKPPHLARAVDAQEADPGSVLHAYRAALAFRRAHPALRLGATHFLDTPEPVLAFQRALAEETLTCVFNLSPGPVAVALSGTVQITGPAAATLRGTRLELPANGYAVLDAGVTITVSG